MRKNCIILTASCFSLIVSSLLAWHDPNGSLFIFDQSYNIAGDDMKLHFAVDSAWAKPLAKVVKKFPNGWKEADDFLSGCFLSVEAAPHLTSFQVKFFLSAEVSEALGLQGEDNSIKFSTFVDLGWTTSLIEILGRDGRVLKVAADTAPATPHLINHAYRTFSDPRFRCE